MRKDRNIWNEGVQLFHLLQLNGSSFEVYRISWTTVGNDLPGWRMTLNMTRFRDASALADLATRWQIKAQLRELLSICSFITDRHIHFHSEFCLRGFFSRRAGRSRDWLSANQEPVFPGLLTPVTQCIPAGQSLHADCCVWFV